MRYGTVALACITMLCASGTLAEEAMRRLGDLRRSDYVVTSLAGVTNDVAELKASVGAVSNDVSDLRALVSTLGGVTNDISALSGYSVLSNDVASLKDGYVGVTNDVAELKSDVGGLETAVTAIDGTLATATNAIDQIGQFASNSWNTTDAYLDYLEDYATNNYMAARLANYRAYRLELWRQNDTNELAKIDGMRPLSDNIAQASSFGDWVISAPSNSVTGWALVFTPDSSNETVGTWSILSGDSLVAMSGPSMARDISELGTNDWFTSSVTPAPTASRIVKTTAGQPYVTYDIIGDLLRRADESTNVTFKIDGDELVISTNSVPVWRSGATAAAVSLEEYLFPTKALTADQEAKGLSYTSYKDGQREDGAIAIGRHAKAAVDDTYLAKLKELLAPVTITDADECMITAKSHTITTISPTNGVVAAFDIVAGASRNYEIYVPNTENTRRGLPCVVKLQALDDTTLVGVGQWWDRKITRLPALFKLREPVAGTVILDVETYDDGTDWTPQVTNAVWSTTNGVMTLEKVQGINLHNVLGVIVTYTNATDAAASNSTTNFTPRYAELDMSKAFDGAAFTVSESDLMAGTTPAVTVTTVEGTNGYRTLNSLLDEKNKGWR